MYPNTINLEKYHTHTELCVLCCGLRNSRDSETGAARVAEGVFLGAVNTGGGSLGAARKPFG